MLSIGSKAPNFTLGNQNGQKISLSDFAGKPVVLFFYPRDFSPGCTAEVCSFRDDYSSFQQYDAVLLGVSQDDMISHKKFIAKHQLPFDLLSDPKGEVTRLYEVKKTLGFIAGRYTFVIDKQGLIAGVYTSLILASKHIKESLKTLDALSKKV